MRKRIIRFSDGILQWHWRVEGRNLSEPGNFETKTTTKNNSHSLSEGFIMI